MNKKIINILFICLISLFLVSAVSAADESQANGIVTSYDNTVYQITSDLTNENVQFMFDNAIDGDTFEFTDKKYDGVSLVVDKKLNIVSKQNSVVHTSNQLTDKARSLGITDTFGFYFTPNSGGSVLTGIKIIASNSDYGIIVDSSDNTTIKNNIIDGGDNSILVKNAGGIDISNNNISAANVNGIQLQNVKNSLISENEVFNTGRSGIETSDIYYCNITNNTVHHNKFNGISLFNISQGNIIKHNQAFENPNGIYINSISTDDVINANTFNYNRRYTDYELGAFESGNGLLFGEDFKTAKEGNPSRLEVKYNVLAHNEGYQAKNNPDLPVFKLGDNWFDSTDDENTFVCPMLIAGIMKMGTFSVKNGIGLQMYDTNGNPVNEFGTFDTTVNVDGNQYTARFVNGKATIDANLDDDKEYDIEVMVGGEPVKYTYKTASGEKGTNQDSQTSVIPDGKHGMDGSKANESANSNSNGTSKGSNISQNGTSTSAHFANSNSTKVYGRNASGELQDSSDNGESALTNGNINAGDSSVGEASQEGKAYEVVPPSKISKKINDTSGLVVLSIVVIMAMLIYGYWRKRDEY
ncbi:hypothetical protein TL18_06395 [Methanobrevibacter sp. YE315]|uniref:NosD domain-containing protein n=1 Tax=Methanobrevibacter sp. YE315 TaxID=1609968 RepID=UPI000764EECE|nr:right-handed parallel beta-helix repeat-containing protein [Methanobrevibacter sp. YE315]AMD17683.1 hypothetical protein TL18_06395 [Methanobrevibacter sp. YE315]